MIGADIITAEARRREAAKAVNATPLKLRLEWTNDAQRQRLVDAFGFGQVVERRTFHVAPDVARRLQERALKASGKTVYELLSENLRVRQNLSLPPGAILCVVERAGAESVIEPHVWPSDRKLPAVADLERSM